ncbi:putative polysaccharide biosynthesis protein [Ligilactobacillus faecis]|uniref:putative polysaccharide biosynthesis protein n=1 Tax=Ligilactobacillus faecis TaxID=762833 RepID=UPI00246987B0|nr:polysaccharide biosynthesis protein [Ligilactobacillus faecis]WGN90494.1 polysaccharide biosynthesis protein [Ligilactobacillus faecis]
MKNEQVKKTMKGALILSVASLIAKILSAVYRIPFENIVGNTGFYVYQQVYPLYGIGMTFALTGFPVYISKLVAEKRSEAEKLRLVQQLFVILCVFSVLTFSGLRIFAPLIAKAMGDLKLAELIKSVAWMLLFMPFLAVGRGYYQGTFNMVKTAVSQVTEQFVRVGLIILAALLFARLDWSLYKMGALAMFASSVGAFVACLSFVGFYRKKFFKRVKAPQTSYLALTEKLFTDGLILCLFASMMVLLQLIDSFTVVRGLFSNGFLPADAKNIKGIYDRAQPLVQLGMVLAVGFSSTLLPTLSHALQQKKLAEFRRISSVMLRVSIAMAVAATFGIIVLMPQINTLLFGDAHLSLTLSVYALSIIFITVIGTYNSILQSLNQFLITVFGLILALIVKLILNVWLIGRLNIMGASLATVISLIVALGWILAFIPDLVKGLFKTGYFWIKLALATGLMYGSVWLLLRLLGPLFGTGRLECLGLVFLGALLGASVFLVVALSSKLFSVREWLLLPGGRKILSLWQNILRKKESK